MARTTATEIKKIIEVESIDDLTPHINAANQLVTEICTGTAGPIPVYSDERLAMIETWLAAHFYACYRPRTSSESAGPVSESYQNSVGMRMNLTAYGQQVLLLDTNGGFATLEKRAMAGKRKPTVTNLGTV